MILKSNLLFLFIDSRFIIILKSNLIFCLLIVDWLIYLLSELLLCFYSQKTIDLNNIVYIQKNRKQYALQNKISALKFIQN